MDGGKVIKQICDDFADSGYDIQWQLLNAADYGVPQNRWRIFFVGHRSDVATFDAESERKALHMAAVKGRAVHPDWFLKSTRRYSKQQCSEEGSV